MGADLSNVDKLTFFGFDIGFDDEPFHTSKIVIENRPIITMLHGVVETRIKKPE